VQVGLAGQREAEVEQEPSGHVACGHCAAEAQAISGLLESEPGGARRHERSEQRKNPGGHTIPVGQSLDLTTQLWSLHRKGAELGHERSSAQDAAATSHLPSGQRKGRSGGHEMPEGHRERSGTHSPVAQVKPGHARVAGQSVKERAHCWFGHMMAPAGQPGWPVAHSAAERRHERSGQRTQVCPAPQSAGISVSHDEANRGHWSEEETHFPSSHL
jgi:hypothetical protein